MWRDKLWRGLAEAPSNRGGAEAGELGVDTPHRKVHVIAVTARMRYEYS